ncbi:hypothetical protein BH10BDE1_BH10BDE1_33240 [soil metagenome]
MKNVEVKSATSFDLSKIQIASPCHEDWSKMSGDERSRHCAACKLNVFNVSEMTKAEAEAMILSRLGKERVCVKLMRRHDGTIITKDCPVGLSRVRKFRMKVASLAFSLFAGVFSAFGVSSRANGQQEKMGKISAPIMVPQNVTMGAVAPPMMGEIAIDVPAPSPTPIPHIENEEPYHFDE